MKSFFEAIGSLFSDILLFPYDVLRELELTNWWGANSINWFFILICCGAVVYWIKKLNFFKANNDDDQDTTAHSYLNK